MINWYIPQGNQKTPDPATLKSGTGSKEIRKVLACGLCKASNIKCDKVRPICSHCREKGRQDRECVVKIGGTLACDRCRHRQTKCDGQYPGCTPCSKSRVPKQCVYRWLGDSDPSYRLSDSLQKKRKTGRNVKPPFRRQYLLTLRQKDNYHLRLSQLIPATSRIITCQ